MNSVLQQYLPLAVLKQIHQPQQRHQFLHVATVLTACGIETAASFPSTPVSFKIRVATVLTACGIETSVIAITKLCRIELVATVLTACGIETSVHSFTSCSLCKELQQYLPLAVLKQNHFRGNYHGSEVVATVLTACGIETISLCICIKKIFQR